MFQTFRPPPELPEIVAYFNFEELQDDLQHLPEPWCLLKNNPNQVDVGVLDASLVLLQVSIFSDFSSTLMVFGLKTSSTTSALSLEQTKLSVYLRNLYEQKLCPGVTEPDLQDQASLPSANKQPYYRHVMRYASNNDVVSCVSCVRSGQCELFLAGDKEVCKGCHYAKTLLVKKHNYATESASQPLSKHDPLHSTSKKKLSCALKATRKSEQLLQEELEAFKKKFETESVGVSETLHQDMREVIDKTVIDDPLSKLFWEQQVKAFQTQKKGMRWHPAMIRLAILLHSRSAAAYETLRETGILKLPGPSTLRDYTNVVLPESGFSQPALQEITRQTKDLADKDRFVVLLHDEMTIKADLVFDRRSGDVIGFRNQHKWTGNLQDNLATHVLVFFVVGVTTSLRVSMGFFATETATAGDLFTLLWQAIGYLETHCRLKVIASTSDKAPSNQKLCQMHQEEGHGDEVCHKAVNMFAPDRHVFFVSDPPHLIKTVRNNLSNSGSGRKTNYFWNDGHDMLWQHVRDVYNMDACTELRRTKLTPQHVDLNNASVMNVRLAAQVLSYSTGKTMQEHGGPAASKTAELALMMDRFFDCLNTRSTVEGVYKRKPDLLPYTSVTDVRFNFLECDFLQYLNAWRQSVASREGYTTQQKNKMFLTHQTFKGLIMTVKAFCEGTRFLLESGVPLVFSNVFCQDPLEEHFGRHRGLGRRADNPNLWAFGYQENKLRIQRSLALTMKPRGNVTNKRKEPVTIDTSPLKKIQRPRPKDH